MPTQKIQSKPPRSHRSSRPVYRTSAAKVEATDRRSGQHHAKDQAPPPTYQSKVAEILLSPLLK
jgi:hypothetical protein